MIQVIHSLNNSMALVRERTIPIERPPLVREVQTTSKIISINYNQNNILNSNNILKINKGTKMF
jgi:hypothetical protein